MKINQQRVLETAKKILSIDSPSGYCFDMIDTLKNMVEPLGYLFETTQKGCAVITVPGKQASDRVIGLSAHADTLGAMVRSITADGTLKFTMIGGPSLPTLDSEYCKIRTRCGKTYTGTFLSSSPAAHVFDDHDSRKRDAKNMEIRIDEVVRSKADVEALGIAVGDFVFIDPKTTVTESGFLKSRFIDDKGSVACLISLLELLKENSIVPTHTLKIFISTYEEVGHGSSFIPDDITEMIAVDMGCIGDDLSCTEYDVSICAKDSGGPYDYHMVSTLIEMAKSQSLNYAVDIYPMYASDVVAALRGGNNIKGALIGPGVHASHGMERTHYKALESTIKLLMTYITAS